MNSMLEVCPQNQRNPAESTTEGSEDSQKGYRRKSNVFPGGEGEDGHSRQKGYIELGPEGSVCPAFVDMVIGAVWMFNRE